jgi:GH15 family glucan-1,4-alpha-glucosidase
VQRRDGGVVSLTDEGRWRDAVLRSLLTLWDYRYCWLRDSGLTLHAFMVGGYAEEARAYRDWLVRTVAGDPSKVQIMYGIAGERRLTEASLDWLPGYEESRPVRIGNGAWDQFQLDVYGETLSCLYAARKMGIPGAPEAWDLVRGMLAHARLARSAAERDHRSRSGRMRGWTLRICGLPSTARSPAPRVLPIPTNSPKS